MNMQFPMGVVVAVMLAMMAVRVDIELPTRNALADRTVEVQMDFIPEPEGGHRFVKNRLRNTKITQSANGHVAADSGKAIEVENSHGNFRPRF
jgi:hypothetical protein